jgi:hypothetical protein
VVYNTNYQQYPSALTDMATGTSVTSTSADLIDAVLATGTKSGYTFAWTGGGTLGSYSIKADPVVVNSTGTVHYFTDQSLVIRSNATASECSFLLPAGSVHIPLIQLNRFPGI